MSTPTPPSSCSVPRTAAREGRAHAGRRSPTRSATPACTRWPRALRDAAPAILAANAADLAASVSGSPAFRDRLTLTERAHRGDGAGAARTSPRCPIRSARTLADWTRPNGLRIRRIATPIGVIGMIYESRPNVGADAAGAVPEVGQRGDPARRLGKPPQRRARSTPRCPPACATPGCPRPRADRAHRRPRLSSPPCWRARACST